MSPRSVSYCSFALMAVFVASSALAQTPPAPQPSTPAAMGAASPMAEQPGPNVEKQIGNLKTKLMITAAQEPQWTAFAGTMRQNAVHMVQLGAGRATQAGTQKAPDEMRGYVEVVRAHAEDMSRLIAPFEALYAVMTPEQQGNADRTFNLPAPGMGRQRRR